MVFWLEKKLRSEIKSAGFKINKKKTRNQYCDSRQDVTGLVVNKKPNTKKEYWRIVRAQCHKLFKTGTFSEKLGGKISKGNINRLEGKLDFIDHLDHYNKLRQSVPLNPKYQFKKEALKGKQAKLRRYLHNGREKTFSRFLFYKFFYGNEVPTILTEGKTDNVYLKAAIHMLASSYPRLAIEKNVSTEYKVLLRFLKYTIRTRYLLELYGGSDYLKDFVVSYKKNFSYYEAPRPISPVIILVDNDEGPKDLINYIKKIQGVRIFPPSSEIRSSRFIHVFHNLYLILTPYGIDNTYTNIESFFTDRDRLRKHNGKCFNTVVDRDPEKDLSKDSFAVNIVHKHKKDINFSNFYEIFDRVMGVLAHYDSIE